MTIHLERKDLMNAREMEVAVHGPDGATHLILCTGMAILGPLCHKTYTFLVGPEISRRQFVGVIASSALSTIECCEKNPFKGNTNGVLSVNLVLIDANYDEESGRVQVRTEVSSSLEITKLAISYNVNILVELPIY